MVLKKVVDICQQKWVIPGKQETNEVSPMITPPSCMEEIFLENSLAVP